MSLETLPPVAKSFFTFCKKCDANRYHTVLAHKTATSAKVKCEVCAAQSTYSLPKAASAKKKTATKTATGKPRVSRASSHQAEYEMLLANIENSETSSYTTKGKFAANTRLQHPKFGIGVVKITYIDKIDVVFADEVRTLMHNRT